MYATTPHAQPALELTPVEAASILLAPTGPPFGTATETRIRVHSATLDVLRGQPAVVTGTLTSAFSARAARLRSAALGGRTIVLQAAAGRRWRTIASGRTGRGGRFRLRYVPQNDGSLRLRVAFTGDASDLGSRRKLGELNVYPIAEASWYGGGGGLACGGVLTSSTLGVANRTLPCGALVTLRYEGRSLRVPVVDRGPFVAGREFDLTEATKRALGFGGVGAVWTTT